MHYVSWDRTDRDAPKLLAEAGPEERIVAIEDTLELTPDHPHVVNLTSRGANAEGAGAITIPLPDESAAK